MIDLITNDKFIYILGILIIIAMGLLSLLLITKSKYILALIPIIMIVFYILNITPYLDDKINNIKELDKLEEIKIQTIEEEYGEDNIYEIKRLNDTLFKKYDYDFKVKFKSNDKNNITIDVVCEDNKNCKIYEE